MSAIYIFLAAIGIYFLVAFLSVTSDKIKERNKKYPQKSRDELLKEAAENERHRREIEAKIFSEKWDEQENNRITGGYYDNLD